MTDERPVRAAVVRRCRAVLGRGRRARCWQIRDQPIRYDLHSITAEHTLLDFDAGSAHRDARLPGT
jgi:hypothetical protein